MQTPGTLHLHFPTLLQNKVIAFEGNIAAGKSVLGTKFQCVFPESVEYAQENVNRKFLGLFYGDPNKYGFAFQIRMLKERLNQLHQAQYRNSYPSLGQLFYWDRSMLGDHMFAQWNHLRGSISREEMEAYEVDAGSSLTCMKNLPYLKDIHMFVLLNSEPAECKRRAESVRQNKEEEGIPLAYYEGIDHMHFYTFIQLIKQQLGKVVILNWGKYDTVNQVLKRLTKESEVSTEQPRIESMGQRQPTPRAGVKIYRTAQDVHEAYASLETLERFKTVYIPDNIMTIDPTALQVTVPVDFTITFYQNAYKRVVLYHLSKRSSVVFYKV